MWLAALSGYQRAFERFGNIHDDVEKKEDNADNGDTAQLWSLATGYYFDLGEGAASRYLSMSERSDGNTLEVERQFEYSYSFFQTANEQADQLNDELRNALSKDIITY